MATGDHTAVGAWHHSQRQERGREGRWTWVEATLRHLSEEVGEEFGQKVRTDLEGAHTQIPGKGS